MRVFGMGSKAWLLNCAILFACPIAAQAAQDNGHGKNASHAAAGAHVHQISNHTTLASGAKVSHALHTASGKRVATRSFGISCVPYARQVSGIQVAGNAWQWWDNASGQYARGDRPETGSVLNFRANGHMHLGHVAVVTKVINSREVIVDHANWQSGGGVSHGVAVVDVSEANNWSAVRVELGREGTFGSVYPTYGFIYNRPDTGVVLASVSRPAPQPSINPVPSDLRPLAERPWRTMEEVAESPSTPRHTIDLGINAGVSR
ncbi:MAG TPA: CHAP domain-containing protein [Acetobacteraceae bacterium]|jgi:surface antigen|nr:CHAP domain-containing protein [Acetobacteraceae bacterium]